MPRISREETAAREARRAEREQLSWDNIQLGMKANATAYAVSAVQELLGANPAITAEDLLRALIDEAEEANNTHKASLKRYFELSKIDESESR
jgi:hypothetical protein